MLIISIAALIAFGLLMARCAYFALHSGQHRQDDRAEVAFIFAASAIFMFSHLNLWVTEPWKMTNNSTASALFAGFTIFIAAYFYHRVGALVVGRNRRRTERRDRRPSP